MIIRDPGAAGGGPHGEVPGPAPGSARPDPVAEASHPRLFDSLRWRLPIFFGALTVIVLLAFLLATWRQAERTLIAVGAERASAAAEELAGTLGRSLERAMTSHREMAQEPAIARLLLEPNEETLEAARAALPATSPGLRRAEVWDAAGRLVLVIDESSSHPESVDALRAFPPGDSPVGEGVSVIRAAGDHSYIDMVVAVRAEESPEEAPLGYLRSFGQIGSSPPGAIRRLVGDAAEIRVGSREAGSWTDFHAVVEAPPAPERAALPGEYRAASGERWVGGEAPIEGSPWWVWVAYPRDVVVAPLQPFMRDMLLVAVGLALVTAVTVGALSARLTRPLLALSRAAREIAGGDYGRRVSAKRRDEIGQLGAAFDTMADRIEGGLGALRESHERTHFTLAAAGIGVWEHEPESGKVVCSESMRLVHPVGAGGLPQDRDAFLAAVYPEDRDGLAEVLAGQGFDETGRELAYRLIGLDGSVRWVEGRALVRGRAPDRPAHVLGVSMDVTERRRMEAHLQQGQKMEAIGQLAAGVAHDFNNLLTAIVGHGELILEQLEPEDPVREDVAEILRAGESASALTRQLLAFGRRQILRPEVVSVNRLILDARKLLQRLIPASIRIDTRLTTDPDTVCMDPSQLEQILVNLAVNARDAMPEGGTLLIRTEQLRLGPRPGAPSVMPPGRYVLLSVEDTGTGMDAETQAHLFEPFFTTKPQGKGTGLGLATVFGIVDQSCGQIEVKSEPGHGSTFQILLPAADLPAALVSPSP